MASVLTKLNLKDQTSLVIVNAPESFEPRLAALSGVSVLREVGAAREIEFVLAFVTKQKEVDTLAKAIAQKVKGDALVWFAYPKGTSKKIHLRVQPRHRLGGAGYARLRGRAPDRY